MAFDAIIRVQLDANKTPQSSSYSVFSGNTVELTFVIADENKQPMDMTGWPNPKYKLKLANGMDAPGWTGGRDVPISTDNIGQCVLRLSASETSSLNGTFNHFLVLTDNSSPPDIGTVMVGQAVFTPGAV